MLNEADTDAALKWLASFHGETWELAGGEGDAGLWEQGCYWHLATRQDELDSIGEVETLSTVFPHQTFQSTGTVHASVRHVLTSSLMWVKEWKELKIASGAIDRRIRGLPPSGNTGANRR